MVVKLGSIPYHIRKDIVEKMNFADFRLFLESSKLARNVGIVTTVTIDVSYIHYVNNRLTYYKYLPSYKEVSSVCWPTVKSCTNRPRLNLMDMVVFRDLYATDEAEEIIREAEAGYIFAKRIEFRNGLEKVDPDMFNRFLKAFNVTIFKEPYGYHSSDPRLLQYLTSVKCKDIRLTSTFLTEDLVGLNAPKMRLRTNSYQINQCFHQWFTEWFQNEREIEYIRLIGQKQRTWANFNAEEIFSGLPYTVLWSRDTHESSMLSILTLDDLRFLYNGKFYSIEKDGKTLFAMFTKGEVTIKKVSNPEREMRQKLDYYSYEKLTGRCKYRCNNDEL